MGRFVALLRGINVGGRNMVPMGELRALCAHLGWASVQTYIQSGNVVFEVGGEPAGLEAALEEALAERFGQAVPVIVRPAARWQAYVEGNPFGRESAEQPNQVMLGVCKTPPLAGAVAALRERAAPGERVEQVDDALWIYFAGGVARSRLTSDLLDRVAGSPVTIRNWRTVLKLRDMASG
ncbi:MAG TPA: DUF1697 domain-containing protein [Bacillota bacterium]